MPPMNMLSDSYQQAALRVTPCAVSKPTRTFFVTSRKNKLYLPVELWRIIFRFLPFHDPDRVNCSMTCRLFRKILFPILFRKANIYIGENVYDKRQWTHTDALALSDVVSSLRLTIDSPQAAIAEDQLIAKYHVPMQHLAMLKGVKTVIIPYHLSHRFSPLLLASDSFLRGLERIEVISEDPVSACFLDKLISRSTDTLTSFALTRIPAVDDRVLATLNTCTRLDTLDLGFAYCRAWETGDETLMGLPLVGRTVRHLTLKMAMVGRDCTISVNGLDNFISLMYIDFCDVDFRDPVRSDQLDSCLRSCKQTLTSVRFCDCYWLSPPAGLLECSQLKNVSFMSGELCRAHNGFLSHFWTSLMSSAPFLTRLQVHGFPSVDFMLLGQICSVKHTCLELLGLKASTVSRGYSGLNVVTDNWWGNKCISSGPPSSLKEIHLEDFFEVNQLREEELLKVVCLFQSHGISLLTNHHLQQWL